MNTSAATLPAAEIGTAEGPLAPSRSVVLLALAGITVVGIVVRFATLGVQSFHHDEVITVARVIPGSFSRMLNDVRLSESNPPLYYVLAWAWAKVFGSGEVGIRSLSALFGAATIPVAYAIGRELASRRAGLIAAALVAVNPMLIWYSQEARSYAPLVFFAALSLLFFLRALRDESGRDLALWALTSALALCSHYFAVFPVGIEAAWLMIALRSRWVEVAAATGALLAVGLALLPLLIDQSNPHHIGWIDHSPLSARMLQTGVSFLAGETGHVIAEPPRERFALIPAILAGIAALLVAVRGSGRERRSAGVALAIGLGVALLPALAALVGKDYVVERNLLPALIPLVAVVAIGFGSSGARRLGLACAVALCVYWLAYDIHVARTPNLQRPDFRGLAAKLGPPRSPRAIVTWKLAADPIRYYLDDGSRRAYRGAVSVREIDVISKSVVAGRPPGLPPAFYPVERIRLDRLTLMRYMSSQIQSVPFPLLRDARTGFGNNAVVADGGRPHPGTLQ